MDLDQWLDYLTGLVLGDGYLYHYRKEGKYYVRITDESRDFLEMLKNELLKIGIRSHIYRQGQKNAYTLEISNKELYYTIKLRTRQLLESPTPHFVAGLIDAEGSLQKPRKGSIRIAITNTKPELLHPIVKILQTIGINAEVKPYGKAKHGEKQRYRVVIYGKENIEKTLQAIPLRHPKFQPPARGRKSGNERDPHP